ncbi:MAG: cytochrome d ubiquinol oxidase subunit II [Actinomycetaceae bacterium]|nr:cytochrome d ubiquinol oxidase subunit II [Actinomycetaceae bacterium]
MDILQILWFALIGVLWAGYLIFEGFDLGVGMLLRVVAKTDRERSQVTRTIGPHWDGNEVWLLTAGGATFAASPEWYATMFSGMYLALFLILLALIMRISAIEWRAKLATEGWRNIWDWIHTVSAWLVPVLFGVAFGNLVQGMKIEVTAPNDLSIVTPVEEIAADRTAALATGVHNLTGGFFSLLTPYTLLGGVVLAALFLGHGALFLSLKTTGKVKERTDALAPILVSIGTGTTAVFALWGQFVYSEQKVLGLIPLVIAALALIAAAGFTFMKAPGKAFIANSVGLTSAVAWIFIAMFPYVMKSSIADEYGLMIADSSSTTGTLIVMTVAAVLLVPVVLGYTIWSYLVFKARISIDDVEENPGFDPRSIRTGANFLAG